jgi:hypothetical protein
MPHDAGLSGDGDGDGPGAPAPGRIVVRNEFGIVAVELCGDPGRERLRISDLRTDASVELDALELESLAWAQHRDLADLLDPGRTRWQREDQEPQG